MPPAPKALARAWAGAHEGLTVLSLGPARQEGDTPWLARAARCGSRARRLAAGVGKAMCPRITETRSGSMALFLHAAHARVPARTASAQPGSGCLGKPARRSSSASRVGSSRIRQACWLLARSGPLPTGSTRCSTGADQRSAGGGPPAQSAAQTIRHKPSASTPGGKIPPWLTMAIVWVSLSRTETHPRANRRILPVPGPVPGFNQVPPVTRIRFLRNARPNEASMTHSTPRA